VREFYCHNALYWLEEYRFDGLRCDAVHAIVDDSPVHIFEEIAIGVDALARREDRHIHIVAENENNVARLLERDQNNRPRRFTAQWNDDFHHNMHVILTGETDAYFVDYAPRAYELLARCLTEGFAYQGEASAFRSGKTRGENSKSIRLDAFINFLQNHDQAGNRPMGDRLITLTEPHKLRAAIAVLMLNPAPPLLFMGEEWGSTQPFPFFCDFGPELSKIIRESRIKEFAVGDKFKDEAAIAAIPDPTAEMTYESVKLDWSVIDMEPHRSWLAYYRTLLALRSIEVVPLVDRISAGTGTAHVDGTLIVVRWLLDDGAHLIMETNLGDEIKTRTPELRGAGRRIIFTTHPETVSSDFAPWSVNVFVEAAS
jgi:malto-oligosyltrehalose trehalohydrolase